MEYSILTMGLSNELVSNLKNLITQYRLHFIISPSIYTADRLLNCQQFHLLIVDLEYLRSIQRSDWLAGIRPNSFAPIIVLSDFPEKDVNSIVRFGGDMCVSGKWPYSVIADLAYAQLRRYTEYNHGSTSGEIERSAFQEGDIYIDTARHVVEVRGRSVNLRPREFSLLLYFMQNPNIVLTSEQICEHAWGMAGSYNQGVSGPIAILRKAIETNSSAPRYIKTVPGVGYHFTAYRDETCDDCSNSVGGV